jgi:DNA-dependent RNA polymerase auxiliary subunit epsilon
MINNEDKLAQIKERLSRKREPISDESIPINGTNLKEFKKSPPIDLVHLKLKRAAAGEEPEPFTEAEMNNYRTEIREGQKSGWYEGIDAEADIHQAVKLRQEQIDYIQKLNGQIQAYEH